METKADILHFCERTDFDFYMDDVAIWRKLLSISDVATIYETGKHGKLFIEKASGLHKQIYNSKRLQLKYTTYIAMTRLKFTLHSLQPSQELRKHPTLGQARHFKDTYFY